MRVTQGRDHSRFSSDHYWLLTLCVCVSEYCKFHSVSKMSCLTFFKNVWNNELSTNCIELQLWLIVYFCCWVWYTTVAVRRDASLHALSGKGRKPPKEEVSLRDIDPIQFQAEPFLSSENQILGGGFKYFLFSCLFGEDFPFWLIFFKGVETTNSNRIDLICISKSAKLCQTCLDLEARIKKHSDVLDSFRPLIENFTVPMPYGQFQEKTKYGSRLQPFGRLWYVATAIL